MVYWSKRNREKGAFIVIVLIFSAIFVILTTAILTLVAKEHRLATHKAQKELAFEIAESGIDYYRWHLAHDPSDYMDGTGSDPDGTSPNGPYVHTYKDPFGEDIGEFSLEITEPLTGSTLVTVESTGSLYVNPGVTRTIEVQMGIPSLAEYVFLFNNRVTFSQTSEVWGRVHSNKRITFHGTSHSTIESAESNNGVVGSGGPIELWVWPVPAIDFDLFTVDLSDIRTDAIADGLYLGSSGDFGYHLIFQNDETIDVYRVTAVWFFSSNDIRTESFVGTYPMPSNGLVYVEDEAWVEGTIRGRVTVSASELLEDTSIRVPNNITYTAHDGTDALGLIAKTDILIPRYDIPTDLTIEAAMLAQFGKVYRPFYQFSTKNSLTIFGSIISNAQSGFKYGNPVVSGFVNTYYYYDQNLRYAPPPGFPTSEDVTDYETILWREIK